MRVKKTATSGLLFLLASIVLFAAANVIIKKLGMIGASHLINGHNPISFCNVLFASNLLAGMVFLKKFIDASQKKKSSRLTVKKSLYLIVITLVGTVLGPTLRFLALMLTSVINVVLISTTQSIWSVVFAYMLLKERPSNLSILGLAVALCGVVFIYFFQVPVEMSSARKLLLANVGDGWIAHTLIALPKGGELLTLICTVLIAFSDIYSRKHIPARDLPALNLFCTLISAIIFFLIAVSVFGFSHFNDLFSPFLWQWMVFYSLIVVVVGTYCWTRAVAEVKSEQFAFASIGLPVLGVLFAYLVLGEVPDRVQLIGGVFLLAGILMSAIDTIKQHR